jgi:raffinose/stachyose/melibiose transport system substrate-binding protein
LKLTGKRTRWTLCTVLLLFLIATGCDSRIARGGQPSETKAQDEQSALSGTIVMLTNRIDLIENGTFKGYADRFKAKYPNANIEFEGLSDYASDILVRLSTRDAGDVLLVPVNLPAKELDRFFEPIPDSLVTEERFPSFSTYEGRRYGISTGTTTGGIVYNKIAFQKAGIKKVPTTLDEFYEACAKLKQSGITPIYMNYGAVWPLREWGHNFVNYTAGNSNYLNEMVNEDSPWQLDNEWGKGIQIARTLIAKGYVEERLFSNNWEISKTKLAKAEAGMYLLGNWSILQVIDAGAASEDIGFFPFPYNNDTTHYAPLNPDWFIGVSKYSKNKELSMAWLKFFVKETPYSKDWGFLPVDDKSEPSLPQYKEFLSFQPKLLEATVQSDEFIELANRAKLSFWSGDYIQELIAAPDLQKAFDELNAKWKEARAGLLASPQK